METAFKGESFMAEFELYDSRDKTRKPDSARYVVTLDGAIVASGNMVLDDNLASFRFNAESVGVHDIAITWTMGLDTWIAHHLIGVRE